MKSTMVATTWNDIWSHEWVHNDGSDHNGNHNWIHNGLAVASQNRIFWWVQVLNMNEEHRVRMEWGCGLVVAGRELGWGEVVCDALEWSGCGMVWWGAPPI